jgi:hypothetical protein
MNNSIEFAGAWGDYRSKEKKPYWNTYNQQWICLTCGNTNYGTHKLCDCTLTITENTTMKKDFKLCFIAENFAYFTTQELSKQTGDDWNDAPYEHNAGVPYGPFRSYSYTKNGEWAKGSDYNDDGTPKWEIYKVAYDYCGAETPSEIAAGNSRYSVEAINNKLTPWLTKYPDKALFAGASVEEFITFIEECGGTVYLPKEKNNAES